MQASISSIFTEHDHERHSTSLAMVIIDILLMCLSIFAVANRIYANANTGKRKGIVVDTYLIIASLVWNPITLAKFASIS